MTKNTAIMILRFYKRFVSPVFEQIFGKACRFTPSCSSYTIEALNKFGFKKGLRLGIARLIKCHPGGGSGYNPVPEV